MVRTAHNPAAVNQVIGAVEAASTITPLGTTVSATPTQAEVQAIVTKLDASIAAFDLSADPSLPAG